MDKPVEVITNGDKRAEIFFEDFVENPRTFYDGHFGIMICSHDKYNLGDEQLNRGDFDSWNAVEEYLVKERDANIILPLYLYDHSGITMRTCSFNDRWDSGQVGFIYTTLEKCIKEFGDGFSIIKIEEILRAEIDEYDMYLTGDVYWYRIFEKEEHIMKCPHCDKIINTEELEIEIDSCGGFYGLDYIREVVKEELGIC